MTSAQERAEIIAQVQRTITRTMLVPLVIGLMLWTFVSGYLAITVHEIYRDTCDVSAERPSWCDSVFPFDHNGSNANQPSTGHHH